MYNKYESLYSLLVNGNITLYKNKLQKMRKKTIVKYIEWAKEMEINTNDLRLDYLYNF